MVFYYWKKFLDSKSFFKRGYPMGVKRVVSMVQVNYAYGQNVFVPYAVGRLQAYAETIPEIRENFRFQNPFFLREDIKDVVKKLDNPAVLGLSCYIWNKRYNMLLAKAVKEAFPSCLIVLGGADVPNRSEGFFVKHPYVDILVHREGEIAFSKILVESLSQNPDYSSIAGLSIRVGTETVKTAPSERIKDFTQLPSPYLAGVFDFMLDQGFVLNATWESNRGCPYQCTFCDWGGSEYTKIYKFQGEVLHEELHWFGRNKIGYLFSADANFGLFSSDVELTEAMIDIRAQHGGWPIAFRMCTAKNSNERVAKISGLLNDAGMLKGATLSFQSMDPTTLGLIKRSNIKLPAFKTFMGEYSAAGIPTYTELIMAMPGETYESTKGGIDSLLEVAPLNLNLYVHACTVLANSEMGDPEYIETHGIKTVEMPILLAHSTPEEGDLTEYNDVIISTKYMSYEMWLKTYMFNWAIQGLHCLGLLKQTSLFFYRMFGVKYSDFYERFIAYFMDRPSSLIGKEILATLSVVRKATRGGRLDTVDPKFGSIYWPLEEISFLRFICSKDEFYEEVREFVGVLASLQATSVHSKLLDDLVSYQSLLMKDPFTKGLNLSISYDLPRFLGSEDLEERDVSEVKLELTLSGENSFEGDVERFAREVVWYGRRGGTFQHQTVTISEQQETV